MVVGGEDAGDGVHPVAAFGAARAELLPALLDHPANVFFPPEILGFRFGQVQMIQNQMDYIYPADVDELFKEQQIPIHREPLVDW